MTFVLTFGDVLLTPAKQPGADSSFPTGRCFLVGLLSRHWWDTDDHKLSVTS